MAKMTDGELLAACKQESYSAETYVTSEVSDEREDAMERYLGEAYGDEQPGRSSVVTRDVLEAVEWAMPSLLRIFISGDDIISYEPVGPEDEDFAEQATDLANTVFNKDNNGFLILNTWMKDALLSKMGTIKTYWNEAETTTTQTYSMLNLMEYIDLISGDDVEVTEHSEVTADGDEYSAPDMDGDEGDFLPPETFHNITIVTTHQTNRIKILNIPPEEFYMSYDAMDPDDANYLEHRASKSRTALMNDGFDRKTVYDLPGDNRDDDPNGERQTRMGSTNIVTDDNADRAMDEVTVHESYIYVDTDDDGVAEWTKVIWAGNDILEQEKVSSQPFSTLCPIPVPHRAYGLSLADLVLDLARIRTVIFRQTLDSLYLANNPEREVDVNKIVDMDDFLTTRAGGIKRVEQIGASREISHPFVAQHSFGMMDGLDSMMARRTGVSGATTSVDANALQNQTATASNNMQATQNQRVEMIARIFAETGVKHLFRRILALLIENQDQPRTIKLRNEWVDMNTNGWNPEMDVTIDVGLGHGNRDQQISHLTGILAEQKELLGAGGMGMVKPKHLYNTLAHMISRVGFKSADAFFDDPGDEQMQQQQQQPNPQSELIQAQMQIEKMKAEVANAEVAD